MAKWWKVYKKNEIQYELKFAGKRQKHWVGIWRFQSDDAKVA